MFEHYDRLGFITPYYISNGSQFVIVEQFQDAIQVVGKKQIDVAAIIEIISRYYCFAERTLVKGLFRTPWMAKPNTACSEWEFADLPSHGCTVMPETEVAQILFEKLQKEILEYCDDRTTVGILLSGGMDSRIVAGTLDYLLKTKQVDLDVIAITWGIDDSRDVVYAQKIARCFGWDWKHYRLSPADLLNNIAYTATRGCEYSPIHLHAMPRVRELTGVDCILAASFGDSVGRAEFSGRHVTKLIPFHHYTFNWFKLLCVNAYNREVRQDIREDMAIYHGIFPGLEKNQEMEIDRQAHYMRRMLNPCMAVINEKIPLFQVFSKPSVFGFMWSLSPQVRNNKVYQHILSLFRTELPDIPWSRTGVSYLAESQQPDQYSKLHSYYGKWIRQEIYDTIKRKVLSASIEHLNVFNMESLEQCLDLNYRLVNHNKHAKLDEILVWLAALADFVEMYNIQGVVKSEVFGDRLNGRIVAPLEIIGLLGANRLRDFFR